MKKKLLFWFFISTAAVMLALMGMDKVLQGGDADFGIVSFELAGNLDTSTKIIDEWSTRKLIPLAAFSLGFDYLYLFLYTIFLSLWTSVLAESFYKKPSQIFACLIICIFIIAGILDAIENYALLNLLGTKPTEDWSVLAFYCASVKFGLIGLGIIYNIFISVKRLFIKI